MRGFVVTPLGAVARAFVAGTAGTIAMGAFRKATSSLAPKPKPSGFKPPDAEQKDESTTETVARRFAEGLMKRPLKTAAAKRRLGSLVHYGFGIGWVMDYAVMRESLDLDLEPSQVPLAGAALGTVVWALGDDTLLPLFRLSAWPRPKDAARQAYNLLSHAVYGIVAASCYESLRALTGEDAIVALTRLRRGRTAATGARLSLRARDVARAVRREVATPHLIA